jgi:hypothetical protein
MMMPLAEGIDTYTLSISRNMRVSSMIHTYLTWTHIILVLVRIQVPPRCLPPSPVLARRDRKRPRTQQHTLDPPNIVPRLTNLILLIIRS